MLLLGRRGSFEDLLLLPVPEPMVADGAIVAQPFYRQAQISDIQGVYSARCASSP